MNARFTARHPVLALFGLSAVLAIAIGLTLMILTPHRLLVPFVEVVATYAGAPDDLMDAIVGAPIEMQLRGIEGMRSSSSRIESGRFTLTVEFEPGRDPKVCRDLVQNRVALAEPMLPEAVRRLGVSVALKPTTSP